MSDEAPRPGSYASLERRVEALEGQVGNIVRDLAVIQSDVRHNAEMAGLHFKTLNAQGDSTKQAVDQLQTLISQAIRDPASVIPGQKEIVADWTQWRAQTDERLGKVEQQDDNAEAIAAYKAQNAGISAQRLSLIVGAASSLGGALIYAIVQVLHP